MRTPRRSPEPRTPRVAATAMPNSARLNRQSRFSSESLKRPLTAIRTIAASTGWGRSRRRPAKKRATTSTMPDATRPESGCPRSPALVDERLRHPAAHREAAAEARGEVRGREGEELLVAVETVPVLARERPADRRGLDRAEEEARHRERQDEVHVGRLDRGKAGHRQALRHLAEERDAALGEAEDGDGGDAGHERDERHRPVRQEALARDQEEERGRAESERRGVRVAEVGEEVAHPLPEVAVAALEAEELRQLRAGEVQGDAGLEPCHHRLGDEADEAARPEEPGGEAEGGDEEGGRRGERGVARGVAGRHLGERRADEERDRRRDGDGRVLRAAEEPEHEPGEQARVEARLGRQPGERRVADRRRQQVRGEDDARDEVTAQPLAAVAAQQRQARNGVQLAIYPRSRRRQRASWRERACAAPLRARGPSLPRAEHRLLSRPAPASRRRRAAASPPASCGRGPRS